MAVPKVARGKCFQRPKKVVRIVDFCLRLKSATLLHVRKTAHFRLGQNGLLAQLRVEVVNRKEVASFVARLLMVVNVDLWLTSGDVMTALVQGSVLWVNGQALLLVQTSLPTSTTRQDHGRFWSHHLQVRRHVLSHRRRGHAHNKKFRLSHPLTSKCLAPWQLRRD